MSLAHKSLIDKVTNEINLSSWQDDFVFSEARYKVACCGRRSGKTIASCVIMYLKAVQYPGSVIWAVATTYGQAKKLYFNELQRIIPKKWITRVNKSELLIELINGSIIELKGSNNEDSLLGDSLDLLVMDEYQSVNPDVMEKLTPMLADRKGQMVVVGTPRGYNHFYDLWCKGQSTHPEYSDNFYSVQVRTLDAETIDEDEIAEARNRMTTSMFAQEFEASFESVEGMVYKDYDTVLSTNTTMQIKAGELLHVGMDFNVNPMTAVVSVKRGNELYIVNEVFLRDAQTKDMCKYLKDHYATHPIAVYPDPAGSARSTTGDTNHYIIEQHGFSVNAFKSHPRIADRINCVNAMFCNAKGERRLFVNPLCVNLTKTLKGHIYDPKTGQPIKMSGPSALDHMGDALGYLVSYMFPINVSLGQYSIY